MESAIFIRGDRQLDVGYFHVLLARVLVVCTDQWPKDSGDEKCIRWVGSGGWAPRQIPVLVVCPVY